LPKKKGGNAPPKMEKKNEQKNEQSKIDEQRNDAFQFHIGSIK
jgi:hypothetical protein